MEHLTETLKVLELVGQVEQGFLKKATANSITNMRAINELAKEHANFVDSIKDLTVDGQEFTFTGYYVNQINQSKETVDSRVNSLNEGVNSTSKGDGMLSRAILSKVEKQREELVKSFDRIADPELIKRFEEADQNFLDSETGIEARIAFYRELASYLQNLDKVELESWLMGSAILEDLREQYKIVFAPVENFTVKQRADAGKFKDIADERLEKASIRLFKKYQNLLLAELKKLVGFPVFADASRIMTFEEIEALEGELDEVITSVVEFKARMEPLEAKDFDLMLASIEKVSDFIQTYLTPDLAKETVTLSFPSLEEIGADSLSDSILWRARFVQLDGFDKQKRIGNKSQELGEISLDEEELNLQFTSVIDGEPGDVGRLRIRGGWAPLQLLLRDDNKVNSDGRSKYVYKDEVNISSYKPLLYGLLLDVPKELPDVDDWPRIFDLKGF